MNTQQYIADLLLQLKIDVLDLEMEEHAKYEYSLPVKGFIGIIDKYIAKELKK